jgi:hypothetical protein
LRGRYSALVVCNGEARVRTAPQGIGGTDGYLVRENACQGLNLCLLFLAPELMRYLLIHELCHGRHMNHSKRFWTLVGRFEPDYRRLDRALTESWREVPAWLGLY